jgi:hypothetical protein
MINNDLRTLQQAICGQDVSIMSAGIFSTQGPDHSFFYQEKCSISVSNETLPKITPMVTSHTTASLSI